MNIALTTGINPETFEKFIEQVNQTEEDITIYLEGEGGQISSLHMFLYVINSNPNRFTIVVAGYNASCNFDLILYSKCTKVITPLSIAGFHLSKVKYDMSSNNTPTYEEAEYYLEYNKTIAHPMEIKQAQQLGLTKSQMKKVNKSYMIYFNAEQIKEFIKQDWNY
jgi:ATP-dependent protease ClpP protease subunit